MKRIIITAIFVILILKQSVSQQPATIYFEQTVEIQTGSGGNNKAKNNLTGRIKNMMVKLESKQGPVTLITLFDGNTSITTTLTDMMGTKQKQIITGETGTMAKNFDTVYTELLNEEKQVAGVICKKALIKLKKNGSTSENIVWYRPDVQLPFTWNFGVVGLELIKGFPMEYENSVMGIKMLHRVTKFETGVDIADSEFAVPDGD
jgi:hypothetical protein